MMTGTSPQNSQMIWRQAPQGGVRVSVSATTAMASNPRSPSETALKMAVRSAQQVRPRVAFSTLQPVKTRPDLARRAAPTRKFEYGAWAFSRARLAAAINDSYSLIGWLSRMCSFQIGCDSWNYGAEQRDELRFHSLAGFHHFGVVDRLIENSGGHVGDA